jgi:hypothetical protein
VTSTSSGAPSITLSPASLSSVPDASGTAVTPAAMIRTKVETIPSSGGLISIFLTGAVIAAVVGALVNVWLARRKSLEEERARVRTTFAEAFEAVTQYKEFPYAIRRRRDDQPAEERVRLSEALREVQSRLAYYIAWTAAESPDVGCKYEALVTRLREVAGGACHDAWLAPPAREDKDMNFPPGVVDLSGLKLCEDAYIAATKRHLKDMLSFGSLWRHT